MTGTVQWYGDTVASMKNVTVGNGLPGCNFRNLGGDFGSHRSHSNNFSGTVSGGHGRALVCLFESCQVRRRAPRT